MSKESGKRAKYPLQRIGLQWVPSRVLRHDSLSYRFLHWAAGLMAVTNLWVSLFCSPNLEAQTRTEKCRDVDGNLIFGATDLSI